MTTFEAMPHSGSLMAQRSLPSHTRGLAGHPGAMGQNSMPAHSSRGSAGSFTANGPQIPPRSVFTDQTNMGKNWTSAEAVCAPNTLWRCTARQAMHFTPVRSLSKEDVAGCRIKICITFGGGALYCLQRGNVSRMPREQAFFLRH